MTLKPKLCLIRLVVSEERATVLHIVDFLSQPAGFVVNLDVGEAES